MESHVCPESHHRRQRGLEDGASRPKAILSAGHPLGYPPGPQASGVQTELSSSHPQVLHFPPLAQGMWHLCSPCCLKCLIPCLSLQHWLPLVFALQLIPFNLSFPSHCIGDQLLCKADPALLKAPTKSPKGSQSPSVMPEDTSCPFSFPNNPAASSQGPFDCF